MGISKIIAIRKCANCNKDVEIRHKDRLNRKHIFCCKKCEGEYRRNQNLNMVCPICNKKFHLKPYLKEKYKTHYCSKHCQAIAKSIYMKNEGNHQYGLLGSKNASWKSDEKLTTYGYIKIRCLDHPFKDCDGFVFEHRLVAEKYLLTEENSVIINNKKYLNPTLIVHHKDFNKLNNDKNNLEIMTLSEHSILHNILHRNLG